MKWAQVVASDSPHQDLLGHRHLRSRSKTADTGVMKRETATHKADLPHSYEASGPELIDDAPCWCGRQMASALHKPILEKAAVSRPRLVTEKGI